MDWRKINNKHPWLSLIGIFLFVLATIVSSSASFWLLHQPKMPKIKKALNRS
jgi:cyclic lactone autoinducer peptide